MALSQPRSQANRASKHMRVASVTPANRAASVTAGMEPRNLDVLRKAHEKEQAEKGEKLKKAPPPKGVLRTLKPIASSVASVGPRMVKFRSNIQYLGEKVSLPCAALSWLGNADKCISCILQQASLRLVHSFVWVCMVSQYASVLASFGQWQAQFLAAASRCMRLIATGKKPAVAEYDATTRS